MNPPREITVRKFRSHAEAEAADDEYYRSLTPQQRMEIFFELLANGPKPPDATPEGHPRICRVTKRARR